MGPPPSSSPPRRRNITTPAADLNAMNSTTNHFLGTRQPAWMGGDSIPSSHNSGVGVAQPGFPINRSIPLNYPAMLGTLNNPPMAPRLSVNTSVHMQREAIGVRAPSRTTPTLYSSVLPSPAPSDEGLDPASKSRDIHATTRIGRGAAPTTRRSHGQMDGAQDDIGGPPPAKRPRMGVETSNRTVTPVAPPQNMPFNNVQAVHYPGVPYTVYMTPAGHMNGIDGFTSSRGGLQNTQKDSVITGRLSLLTQASQAPQDLLFLALHQILCLSKAKPAELPSYVLTLPSLPIATTFLGSILGEVKLLELGFVEYFADFPLPIHLAMKTSQQYAGAVSHAVEALSLIGLNYARFEAYCIKNQHPPMIWEMVQYLGIHSLLLERILCTAIVRRTFAMTSPTDKAVSDVEKAYREYQKEYSQLVATTAHMHPGTAMRMLSTHEIHRRHAGIIDKIYDVLRSRNTPQSTGQHSLPTPSSVGQSPVAPHTPLLRQLPATQPVPDATPSGVIQSHSTTMQGSAILPQRPGFVPGGQPSITGNGWVLDSHGRLINVGVHNPWPALPSSNSFQPMEQPVTPIRVPHPIPPKPQFFARPGVVGPQITPADPFRYALHQAGLRSPVLKTQESAPQPSVQSVEEQQLFQYIGELAMPIEKLDDEKKIQEWRFNVSVVDFSNIPPESSASRGHAPTRTLGDTSRTYRLRCVKIKDKAIDNIHDWAVAETSWPQNVYFNCNGTRLQPRRKLFFGKDLAIDITQYVKQGENTIKAMSNRPKDGPAHDKSYLLAVEVVRAASRASIKTDCLARKLSANDALAALKQSLKPHKKVLAAATATEGEEEEEEEEITITNNSLTIPLLDPFLLTSIWTTPVRSLSCLHRDCFDLDIFLDTRTRKSADTPSDIDVWACPLCRGDARPNTLFVDGWMQDVRERVLREGESAAAPVKAVVVKEDGNWSLQRGGVGMAVGMGLENGKSGGRKRKLEEEVAVPKEVEVIMLDVD